MWTEAVVYTAISVGLGYLGWGRKSQAAQAHVTAPATGHRDLQPAAAATESTPPACL
jgi:hypothetical protein